MFFNNLTGKFEDTAAEYKHGAWFIRIGFAGFNSRSNNFSGYHSEGRANDAVLYFQNKAKNFDTGAKPS